jgi:hypothetical protein
MYFLAQQVLEDKILNPFAQSIQEKQIEQCNRYPEYTDKDKQLAPDSAGEHFSPSLVGIPLRG